MLPGELSFEEVVERVHGTVASALAHADVAQIQIIAELARHQHLLAFNAIPYQVWMPSPHVLCAVCAKDAGRHCQQAIGQKTSTTRLCHKETSVASDQMPPPPSGLPRFSLLVYAIRPRGLGVHAS